MSLDPYRELGVPRDADEKAIKSAYRTRAHKAHPDKPGGDKETFQRLASAYALLTDERRRADYDRTGDAEAHPRDERAAMMEELAALFSSVIDGAEDIDGLDLVASAAQVLHLQLKETLNAQERLRRRIDKRERALKRLRRRKGGEDLVLTILAGELQAVRQALERAADHAHKIRQAMTALREYEYEIAPTPAAFSRFIPSMRSF